MDDPKLINALQNIPNNFLQEFYDLKEAVRELQLAETPPVEEINDGRITIAGTTIFPAEGVLVADPTASTYTGGFFSGDGILFGSDYYVLGNVINGVIKTGFTDVGTLYAVDANISGTISIGTGSSAGGWLIDATKIYNASISLDSSIPAILVGSATDIMTGSGVFIGNVGGTYEMRIGDPAGTYLLWDGTTLSTAGQWIKAAGVDQSLQTWQTDIVFSSASDVQVNWTSGSIVLSDGTTYTIVSGNTGTMSALTYIYLDIAISLTILQVTATYTDATGDGKILVAAAQNASAGASVLPYAGQQPIINGGTQITALSILAGNIAAGAITATKISVTSLSAITATMGNLTIDSKLTMSGVTGAIAIGTTPPTSATVGTGLWIDRTGVYSLLSNVQQATLTSTGFTAIGGLMTIDSTGLTLPAVVINEKGIIGLNGAYTVNDAFIDFPNLGWLATQKATSNGQTRKLRIGLQDNGVNPELVIQFYEPVSDETITNHDFSSLDLTGWTQNSGGAGAFEALADLNPSASIYAIANIGDDIYAAGNGLSTSAVWKYDAAAGTWAPYGSLTATNVYALLVVGSDVYAATDTGATSKVYKSTAGGNFAAYGALLAAGGTAYCLAVIGSDIYVGTGTGATSKVYKSASGGNFSAYGALLAAGGIVYCLLALGSDLYAGTDTGATSKVYKSASGASFAAYGGLTGADFDIRSITSLGTDIYVGVRSGVGITSNVYKSTAGGAFATYGALGLSGGGDYYAYSLLAIGKDIYVGTGHGSTSKIYKSIAGANFAAYGVVSNSVRALLNISGQIYAGLATGTTSSVWYSPAYNWDASAGYVSVQNGLAIPDLETTARFAVTAGDKMQVTVSTKGVVPSGSTSLIYGLRFYSVSSGGTKISDSVVYSRTLTADGDWLEIDNIVVVPATATYAAVYLQATNTVSTLSTAEFRNVFASVVDHVVELILDDDDIKAKRNNHSYSMIAAQVVKVVNTELEVVSNASEASLFEYVIPGGELGTNGLYELKLLGSYKNNTGSSRIPTLKVYYGSSSVTIYNTTISTSATRQIFVMRIILRASNSTSSQYLYRRTDRGSELAESETDAAFTADSTVDQTFKLTVTLGASNANLSFIVRSATLTYLKET